MFWILILSFVAFMTLVILIYLAPGQEENKEKKLTKLKKKEKINERQDRPHLINETLKVDNVDKDWEIIAKRWEKNNVSLTQEIEQFKTNERRLSKEMEAILVQKKETEDRLKLEKTWREKEQSSIDKSKVHEKSLKDQIFSTENDLEKEHSHRLRIERDSQELKIKFDALLEEKRQLAIKASSQETTLQANIKQIKELSIENAKLKEKREDVQWIAKATYDELQTQYQLVMKEIEKLKAS